MLQNPCKTLGFKKNMVYKIPPGGGGKPYPASGLYIEKHGICLKDCRIRSFLSTQYVHDDLCKHLGIDSRSVLESIPKCLHKSPCACLILKNDLIL